MKIKILHILNSLQIGGLENGVVNLINHLDDDKFEHAICCIDSSGPMADKIKKKNIQIYEIKKNGRDYLLPFKLSRVIKQVRPDIVHTRNWAAIDGVIGAKLSGIKYVIHGEHGREATDPTGSNFLRKKARRFLSPFISRFVVVSAELRDWLLNDVTIPEKKVVQIINGVDAEHFKPVENKNLSKVGLGFAPDSFIIGTVARLDPVKDIQSLIRAFSKLVNTICKATNRVNKKEELLIIGSGKDEGGLKSLANELGVTNRTHFMGECRNISELMNCMDVFVLPSAAEGISNTILEAMACGLPVVTTSVGGNPELISAGATGYLFPPGNYNMLASYLTTYLSNSSLVIEHGLNSRKRVLERFSLPVMVRNYSDLYMSVIGD